MANENDHPETPELESRDPTLADLRNLCRELNHRHARYIVVGGFAIAALGFNRHTMDIDLLVDVEGDNESRVLDAVATLPDGAARELTPGDIARWTVVRVGDEIVVDLMKSACGVDYHAAKGDVQFLEIEGVAIPFASAELMWRMKKPTHREKDIPDLQFLRHWFESKGRTPPGI